MKKLLVTLLAVISMTLLVACGADIDRTVTLYQDEEWKAEMSVKVPTGTLALAGSPEDLEATLGEFMQEAQTIGVDASWQSEAEDDSILYTINMSGQGLDTLSETVFEDNAEISVAEIGGKRQIVFRDHVSSDLLSAGSNTLTLVGGEILRSNGNKLNKGTVQWVNPSGRIEATLTEKSGFNPAILLVVALIGATVVAGVFFWRSRSQGGGQCQNCGAWLAKGAAFCPNCGHKR